MEILKGFVFDIQRFATYTVSTDGVPWRETTGKYFTTDGTTWVKVGDTAAADIAKDSALASYDASTKALYVAASDVVNNATSTEISISVGTFANDAVTAGNAITPVTETNTGGAFSVAAAANVGTLVATTGAAKLKNNKITAVTGGITLSDDATLSFDEASGTVTDASGGKVAYTLASATVTITDDKTNSKAVFSDWSKGTISNATASIELNGTTGTFEMATGAAFTAVQGATFTSTSAGTLAVASATEDATAAATTAGQIVSVASDGNVTLKNGTFTTTKYGDGLDISTGAGQEVVLAGVTYNASTTAVATSATAISVTAGTATTAATNGILKVTTKDNGVYTTTANTAATYGADGSITNLTAGTVQGAAGKSLTYGTTTYTPVDTKTGQVKIEYQAGEVGLSAVTGTPAAISAAVGKYTLIDTGVGLGDVVDVVTSTDGVKIAVATGNATITGLATIGEKVTITDRNASANGTVTYEVVSTGVVKQTGNKDGKDHYFKTSEDTAFTDAGSASEIFAAAIKTSSYTTGTTYFNKMGIATTTKATDTVATLEAGTSKTLTVTGQIEAGVDAKNDTVTIKDNKTDTEYTLSSAATVTTSAAGDFTVTEGVVSNATTALALVKGTTALDVSGSVSVDATNANTAVLTYKAGAAVDNAKVTIGSDQYFTLTENNNSDSAEDTKIDLTKKAITGVDAEATIKTNGITKTEIASIATTGSGTFTFNKTSCVVDGDSNGVTFGVSATADMIEEIANLDREATVKISSKLSGVTLKVGADSISGGANTTFSDLNAKNGATFTSINTTGAASVTVFAKGDSVNDSTRFYTVDAMGSADDGVVIGKNTNGTLAALNDGDKITVTDNADPTKATKSYTYEVSGNLLVVTDNITSTNTKTYTLSDSNDTGFTVSNVFAPSKTTINGDEGEATAVTFGTTSGTNLVNSITDGMYISAEGKTTTDSSKSVAKVTYQDDLITYASQSSKGQEVSVGGGTDNWNITTGTGRDTISYAGTTDATIDAGAGDDEVTIAGTGDRVVNTGDGKNRVGLNGTGDITLTLGSGKDTVIAGGTNTNGDLSITANGGNNLIDLSAKTKGDVTITGGSGDDTIYASSTDDVITGNGGKNTFAIGTKGITVKDYSFDSDVILTNGGFTVTDEGKIVSGGNADISATAGDYYAAQIVTVAGGKAQNWAWAKDGGSTIDITAFTKDAHLHGDADGVNVLYAGSGDDVIVSSAENDSVYGGAGKDYISLTTVSGATGRVVGVATTSSKDTVSGFKTGFSDGDSIFMVDGAASDVKASYDSKTKQVTFKDGSGSLQMDSISAGTSGAVELNISGAKLAVLEAGGKATVDSATYADIFYGDGSAVDFSKVDGDLNVNLSNDLASTGEGAKFVGITSVAGGAGANTLVGSAKADSIVAGTGKSSLYGGVGADTLVGNGEADMFFFGDNTGTNTIEKFQAAGVDNADTVKILGDVTAAKLSGSTIELGTTDGSKAVIKSLASGSINSNTMVKIESNNFTGVAKLGDSSKDNTFTYDKSVSFYGGASKTDKVSVAAGFADNAEVWLDGSKGTAYASVDVIDFANGTGNYVLAGDSSKNTIVGGKSDNALWGGAGASADSLKGGTGKNNFYYGLAEGNDTISSSSADDTVNLYNISLSDITGGEITNTGVWLSFTDGSKLNVATNKDIKFTMSDGSTYTAEHSSKSWK